MFKQELNITNTQFTLIYSVYSWPNVFLCFVGGFLIDRFFGIRMGTIIYLGLLLIGQLIFACGGFLEMYSLLIFGRFIFGIGSESLAVAQNSYAVLWFKGKELNMVFGLQMSIARFGSTVNFWVMQPLYDWVHSYYPSRTLGAVLLLATTTCLASLIAALILGKLKEEEKAPYPLSFVYSVILYVILLQAGWINELRSYSDAISIPLDNWPN